MRLCGVVFWLLFLVACDARSHSEPVPPQGRILRPVRFDRLGHYVAMNRPNAEMYFLRDVIPQLQLGSWRWTGRQPTLRFDVPVVDGLAFTMDFTVPEVELREIRPLTITFRVNGHILATNRYGDSEIQHLSLPVPAAFISRNGVTVVSAETDKVWRTRVDGQMVEVGFILMRAGFVQ